MTAKRELLNANKDALRVTHILTGIDFNKPYQVIKHYGAFTINKLIKLAGSNDFVILFKSEYTYYFTKQFCFATVEAGKLNINYSISTRGVDNAYCKRVFDDYRKQATEVFIIVQDRQHRMPLKCAYNCNNTPMSSYANNTNLEDRLSTTGARRVYIRGCYYYLDKSGYTSDIKAREYMQRARQLRAEREKSKADAVNIDSELAHFEDELIKLKTEITSVLYGVSLEGDKMHKISLATNELYHAIDSYEFLRYTYDKKDFSRESSIKYWVDNVGERIAKVKEHLNKINNKEVA